MDITAIILELLDKIFAIIKKIMGLVPSITIGEDETDAVDETEEA